MPPNFPCDYPRFGIAELNVPAADGNQLAIGREGDR